MNREAVRYARGSKADACAGICVTDPISWSFEPDVSRYPFKIAVKSSTVSLRSYDQQIITLSYLQLSPYLLISPLARGVQRHRKSGTTCSLILSSRSWVTSAILLRTFAILWQHPGCNSSPTRLSRLICFHSCDDAPACINCNVWRWLLSNTLTVTVVVNYSNSYV